MLFLLENMSKSIIYLSIIYYLSCMYQSSIIYLSQFLMQQAADDIHWSLLFTLNNRFWRSVHSSIWRYTSFLFTATSFIQPVFHVFGHFQSFHYCKLSATNRLILLPVNFCDNSGNPASEDKWVCDFGARCQTVHSRYAILYPHQSFRKMSFPPYYLINTVCSHTLEFLPNW